DADLLTRAARSQRRLAANVLNQRREACSARCALAAIESVDVVLHHVREPVKRRRSRRLVDGTDHGLEPREHLRRTRAAETSHRSLIAKLRVAQLSCNLLLVVREELDTASDR